MIVNDLHSEYLHFPANDGQTNDDMKPPGIGAPVNAILLNM